MPRLTKTTDSRQRRLSRPGRVGLLLTPVLLTGSLLVGTVLGSALPETAAVGDTDWQSATAALVAAARQAGVTQLAGLIEDWPLPDESDILDRQVIVPITERLQPPLELTAATQPLWEAFVTLRRQRAARFFDQATEAVNCLRRATSAHTPTTTSEAVRLLFRTLREDPDHADARRAVGYVRRDDCWVWPNVARRLSRRQTFTKRRGWQPRGRLAAPANAPKAVPGQAVPLAQADRFASAHWEIRTTAGLEAAGDLAERLEATRLFWLQAFGGFAYLPSELQRRLAGQARPLPTADFKAVLLADRRQYIAELELLEPRIARTLGIYWTPTQTAWFFLGDEPPARTVEHEATHQLFAESRRTSPAAGSRHGMWALEAVACYMESLEATPFGFTLGGRSAGRVPAARERLLDDGFFVPLRELCRLDRASLQNDPRLPQIYSQLSGLADFFLNGDRGRYRDAFLEYLIGLYRGTADSDTLWKRCDRTPEQLDDAYRRHLAPS